MAASNHTTDKAAQGQAPSRLSATLAFDAPVSSILGVARARTTALGKLGIRTVRDLLTHYPRRYIDMSQVSTVAQARINDACTLQGEVYEIKLKQTRKRWLTLVEITLVDESGTCMVTCFRQPWLMQQLHKGDRIAVSGKVEFNYGFKRMTNPHIEKLEEGERLSQGLIVAVHPASEKVTPRMMRQLVRAGLSLCRGLDDPLPLELRLRWGLQSRGCALRCIHFPNSMEEAAEARRRLAYEEVLLLELDLMRSGAARTRGVAAFEHVTDGPAVRALAAALPFELTDEQARARDDLLRAMSAPKAANHMLLGDVGTGKTAVAAFGLAAAADSGTQALMMGPTEVLARQYAEKLGPLLDAAGVTWGLLTGSTDAAERQSLLDALTQGSLTVLFGTHALLEDAVAPRCCSFVVIDEQQRFGVEQRARLAAKGPGCDVLAMTATPIPRTLALALFGDMTLSYIKHRPVQHAPTATYVFDRSRSGEAYDLAREALEAGHQVYVVCPLVGSKKEEAAPKARDDAANEDREAYAYARITIESERDLAGADARAAVDYARYLQEKVLCGYRVGVLHGRMKAEEKARAMDAFRNGEVQVLVSTTVIEVGVDVPNATCMIVEDADRFGLAQLHQLRGRVGRGEAAGTVALISASKTPEALARLQAMERTDDGFELAEYDLSLRREGDILGNRQHGASVLKLVNVVRDADLIQRAHDDAEALLDRDPDLSQPQHRALAYELARAFRNEKEQG